MKLSSPPRQLTLTDLAPLAEIQSNQWPTLASQPLLIVVGLTGVGKTTVLEALHNIKPGFSLLPDRRLLTERFIIGYLQKADGQPVRPISRFERYPYIRRYRELFPGGMAHVLAGLAIDPQQLEWPLVFNGLRGENEIRHAVEKLPLAQFIALDAPDLVRVQRLLKRNDPHDRINGPASTLETAGKELNFDSLGVAEARHLFNPVQEQQLLDLVQSGAVTPAELRDKLRIIIEEQHNYDQRATLEALQALAPHRTLVIDTTMHNPEQTAQAIVAKYTYLFERS